MGPEPVSPHDRIRGLDAILWILAFFTAGLTIWLSLGPTPPGTSAFPDADKVWHSLAYFVTTSLLLLAAVWRPGRGRGPFPRMEWLLPAAMLMAGALIEYAQARFTTTRKGELADWLAEVAGVLLAVALNRVLRKRDALVDPGRA
jgi:VanZ family protein